MSVSAWSRRTEQKQDVQRICEKEAVKLLRGAGGGREWWTWPESLVGHLRVALTPEEAAALPPWCGPVGDAGESGPERSRTR
ncbi:MAG TPA: hypothetical protein VK599_22240 [Streptosporangiaceae bacterium]|nr:hypothetical protein [Streptosporangiaceae bacterium]